MFCLNCYCDTRKNNPQPDLKVGLWVILNLASTTIVLLKQEKGEWLLKTFLKMLKCLFFFIYGFKSCQYIFLVYFLFFLFTLIVRPSYPVLPCSTCSHDAIQIYLFHSPSASASLTIHFPSSNIFHSLFPYDVLSLDLYSENFMGKTAGLTQHANVWAPLGNISVAVNQDDLQKAISKT